MDVLGEDQLLHHVAADNLIVLYRKKPHFNSLLIMSYTSIVKVYICFFCETGIDFRKAQHKLTIKGGDERRPHQNRALRGCSRSEYHGRDGSDVFM